MSDKKKAKRAHRAIQEAVNHRIKQLNLEYNKERDEIMATARELTKETIRLYGC